MVRIVSLARFHIVGKIPNWCYYLAFVEVETELKKESAYRGETESVAHLETEREIAYKNSMNALDDKTIMDEKHKKLLRGIEQIFWFVFQFNSFYIFLKIK